jgi:endonuclease YncB( thermonuclease family)
VINFRALVLGACLCAGGWVHGEALRPDSGQAFTARVIAVLDGDTVLIRREGGLLKIRLAEIDAPEKAQTFGATSSRSLSDMVKDKQVKIVSQTMDQYGRMVAHLSVAGLDVNAEQIRRGMAWEYSNFHSNKALVDLQNEARQAPRGLWTLSNPQPPWEWRKQHPGTFSKQPDAAVSSVIAQASTILHDPGCGNKRHCSEMSSCEEALFYLEQCGVKSLDSDGNGIPCEQLCAPRQKSKN